MNLGMSNWSSDQRYFVNKPSNQQLLPPLTQVRTQQQLHHAKKYQQQQQQQQRQHPFVHFNGNSLAPQVRSVCGVQPLKSKLQKRIIGGGSASFGEFPWQVHIRIAGFQCGGVLLNNQYIATAAHCVHRWFLTTLEILEEMLTTLNNCWTNHILFVSFIEEQSCLRLLSISENMIPKILTEQNFFPKKRSELVRGKSTLSSSTC